MKDLIVTIGAYLSIIGTFITVIKNIIDIIKSIKNGNKGN